MNIIGVKSAQYLDVSGDRVNLVLSTDDGDMPFTFDPRDTSTVTEYVRVNLRAITIDKYTPPTIEALRVLKSAEVAEARWNAEVAPFWYEPKQAHFDTSERSQIKYIQALTKGLTVMWKTYEGWVEMKQADFAGLISAYEAFVAALFQKEAHLQQLGQEAETNKALNTIEW